MNKPKPIGLSRRDLEWIVQDLTRQLPTDPAARTRLLCDVIVALIDKNNAAIAKALADADPNDAEGGKR